MENQLDRENEIYLAEMKAISLDDGGGTANIESAANRALKQSEINLKYLNEQNKVALDDRNKINERLIKEKELSLKNKEIESKKEIEAAKLEQIKVQNKNQELLADKKAKLDKEMMDKKMKIEEMKAKAAIAKSKQKPK